MSIEEDFVNKLTWLDREAVNKGEIQLGFHELIKMLGALPWEPVQPASYVVWSDGGTPPTYYAKNGDTGQIEFSGTDFAPIMRSLDVTGNHILIKDGGYIVNSDILITQDNIIVEGESWDTVLVAKDQPITTLSAGVNIGDTVLPVASTAGFNIGEYIYIDPLGANPESKYIQNIGINTITVTALANPHAIGVDVLSAMNQLHITGDRCSVKNIKLDGNAANWPNIPAACGAAYEIRFYDGDNLLVEHVEITNSRHRPLRGRGKYAIINKCYFHDMSASGGVHIEGVAGGEFSHITVTDSVFIMPSGIASTNFGFVSSFGDYLKIDNCYFYGGLALRITDNSVVSNSIFIPNDADVSYTRLFIDGSKSLTIDTCVFDGNQLYLKDETIDFVLYETRNIVISNNQFNNDANISAGNNIESIDITNNMFNDVTNVTPIYLAGTGVTHVKIEGNHWYNCTGGSNYASSLANITGLSFVNNIQYNSRANQFSTCVNVNIAENVVNAPTTHSFRLLNSTIMAITGNQIMNSGSRGFSFEAQTVDPNTLVIMRDNLFTAVTTPILITGTWYNIDLPRVNLPFIDGTTFLSADGAPWGWEIDLDTEYAIAIGDLPPALQKIFRIYIKAVSLVAEADAMRLEINGYGGASNEALTQETIAIANKSSTTTNFAANDYIYWTLTSIDDADIEHLLGLDSVMFKVKHEAAGDGDCETDAVFLCMIIEYY